jgi:subtilisin-like proprotein convertase family protein
MMKLLHSSIGGLSAKAMLAGFLMIGLVACPPAPADLTPDGFVIAPVTGAAVGVDTASTGFTVSGITAAVPISVIGGKYQIDSAAFTSTSGTVSAGQTVKVSLVSSNFFGTSKTATITVGGITAPFSVTTRPIDTTPDAFSFVPTPDASLNTRIFSNQVTITGIDSSASVAVTGGEYSINGGAFTDSNGTIANGQSIQVRGLSSSSFLTATNTTLTIGGVPATFVVTTRAFDSTPENFSFPDVTDARLGGFILSSTITVVGFDNAPISVSGGLYLIGGGLGTDQPGTIKDGDTLTLGLQSSVNPLTKKEMTVTIGGVSATFSVTTKDIDQTPDAFSFSDLSNATRNIQVVSTPLTITGFETAPISIVGGFYRINDNPDFITTSGTINNNDTIHLSIISPTAPATSQKVTVTIGTVSTTWTVTTDSLVSVLAAESFPIGIANGSGVNDAIYGAASVINFSVPDFAGVVLDKVALQVKITHPQRNDLEVVLRDPTATAQSGFNTIYFASSFQTASNNIDATFDEAAPNAFGASCSTNTTANSCVGLIRPFESFTFLNVLGQNPTGNWQVRVRDGYSQIQSGQQIINSMSLKLTYKSSLK